MEDIVLDLKLIKDELASYKAENNILRGRIDEMGKEMVELQKKYVTLQKQISEGNNVDEAQSDSKANTLENFDDKISSLDEKVNKTSLQFISVEKSVTSLNEEVNKKSLQFIDVEKSVTSLNEEVNKKSLQFIGVEKSVTSLNEEVNNIKNEISHLRPAAAAMGVASSLLGPLSPQSIRHPSTNALSMAEAEKITAFEDKCKFSVSLNEMPMFYKKAMWIGGYTVSIPCDFMDPVAGVYTVPVKGTYKFCVGSTTGNNAMSLFLCTDSDNNDERKCISGNRTTSGNWKYEKEELDCLAHDKVWVEVVTKDAKHRSLYGLVFSGVKVPS